MGSEAYQNGKVADQVGGNGGGGNISIAILFIHATQFVQIAAPLIN